MLGRLASWKNVVSWCLITVGVGTERRSANASISGKCPFFGHIFLLIEVKGFEDD